MNDFARKHVAVLGFGVEGKSTVQFLLKESAYVSVFDEKEKSVFDSKEIAAFEDNGIVFHFGTFPDEFVGFDFIVHSPGVNPAIASIINARKKGIIITSPSNIFFSRCPCKIIGVTGTKGKGTTSTLIWEMLKEEGKDVYLGGNIGTPPLDFVDQLRPTSTVVLELSSFQLQDINYSPHIAVMLMITSEHLDYHKDIYEYVEAKRNIVRFQGPQDYAILNRDYPASHESDIYTEAQILQVSLERGVERGCFVRDGAVWLKMEKSGAEEKIIEASQILVPGQHNLENVCAAVTASALAGASKKTITHVLKTFKGLEHRLELVGTIRGARFYDDSFSTTPETAAAAINAFEEPEIIILGGSSKKSDFTRLGALISSADNIKAIIGIGIEWGRIKSEIRNLKSQIKIIENCKNMHEIVKEAVLLSEPGDVVLLSPACASFDMFKNYKDRGEQFKEEVFKIKAQQASMSAEEKN